MGAHFPRSHIREQRRARKAAKRNAASYIGGSATEQARLQGEAKDRTSESRGRSEGTYEATKKQLASVNDQQASARRDYGIDRGVATSRATDAYDSIGQIKSTAGSATMGLAGAGQKAANEYTQGAAAANATRSNALATGSLAGTAESVLAQRQAALAAAPSIQQANETNIAANAVNAGANQERAAQMITRQGMGLAAGQGEGGALAMQQALASAGSAIGDNAGQSNLALNESNAAARYAAAMAQNAQTVDSANLGLSTRMDAAAAERANQMGVAQANAGSLESAAGNRATAGLGVANQIGQMSVDAAKADQAARAAGASQAQAQSAQSGAQSLQLAGLGANLASGNATTATAAEGADKDYQSQLLTAQYKAGQDNKTRSTMAKVFMPFGILGQ